MPPLAPPPHPTARSTRRSMGRVGHVALATLVVGSGLSLAGATAVVTSGPASAASPFTCTDTLYLTDRKAGPGRVLKVSTNGTVSGTTEYTPTSGPATFTNGPNQLGLANNGTESINVDRDNKTIVDYTPSTGQTKTVALTGNPTNGVGVAGGINPRTNLYYFGNYGTGNNANVLTLYVYNPTTGATDGPVASVTAPSAPSGTANGDLAFSKTGDLFFVDSSTSTASLYKLAGPLPTSGTANTAYTATQLITANNLTTAANGIAFGSDGYLYLGQPTQMTKINPITGAQVGNPIAFPSDVYASDLASCDSPSQLTVQVSLPDGRIDSGDQFTTHFEGSDYDGSPAGPSGTTSGSGGGDQSGAGSVAQGLVLPGDTYTATVGGASSTNDDTYATSYKCTNDVTGDVVYSGYGNSVSYQAPTGTGAYVTCSFATAKPNPAINLTTSVDPPTYTRVGQVLTYSYTVTNTGNAVFNDFSVNDSMPGLSAVTCTPAQGTKLNPGDQATCQATYTVTRADIDAGATKTNSPTAKGTPAAAQGSPVTKQASASSQFRVTPPSATDDNATTPYATAVQLPAGTNDTAGSGQIDQTKTVFTSADATTNGTRLTTSEGSWAVNTDGTVTFTPKAGYVGTTAPVQYKITDDKAQTATANLSVVVRKGPSAVDDTDGTTSQGQKLKVSVLSNDSPGDNADGSSGSLRPGSVVFDPVRVPANATISDAGKTLTVPTQGSYAIDSAGAITFTPKASFTGTTSPVGYRVTDSLGNTAAAVMTVQVGEVDPTTTDDQAATTYATPVTLPAGTNDIAGPGGAIDQSKTVLTGAGRPTGSTLQPDGKKLTTPEGVWTVQSDGTVVFAPAAGFSGAATPAPYRITDANGQTATGSLQVTVRSGPSATNDAPPAIDQDTPTPFTVTGNDTPGKHANNSAGTFPNRAVTFGSSGQPSGSSVSSDAKTLTTPQGTYVANADNTVTFTPVPAFHGQAPSVTYTVTDDSGNPASATLTVTVRQVDPSANDDTANTPYQNPVQLPAGNDDTPADASGRRTIDQTKTVFTAGNAGTLSGDAKTLTASQGTWVIDPTSGVVTFTPAPGYVGTTPKVTYQITDATGQTATAGLQVTVRTGPSVMTDRAVTGQNVNVPIRPLDNDTPSQKADGTAGAFDTGSLQLVATSTLPAGSAVTNGGKTLTVPGQGVYTVAGDGTVTFDPETAFTGRAATVTYQAVDQAGNQVSSTLSVRVDPITPVANDDTVKTTPGVSATLHPLANDRAGDVSAPLQPASVVFTDPAATDNGTRLAVAGEGSWTLALDQDGKSVATFTPEAGFTDATTTPVTYRVSDANGTTATATMTVVVGTGAVAVTDTPSTPQATAVTIDPLANDVPGDQGTPCTDYPAHTTPSGCDTGTFDVTSVVFTADQQPGGAAPTQNGHQLVVAGQGTYVIDPQTGRVTFTPVAAFSGATSPVRYQVTDSYGNKAIGTIKPTVRAIRPTATNDSATTLFATPVDLAGIANDSPGTDDNGTPGDTSDDVTPALAPASTVFTSSAATDNGHTLVVAGQGTWTMGGQGKPTFTPYGPGQDPAAPNGPGYSGTTTPVRYRIYDANGSTATATLTVTVQPGPVAAADEPTTAQHTAVTIHPLDNDTPGRHLDGTEGSWRTGSVVLELTPNLPANSTLTNGGTTLTVPGEGVYQVNPDGTIDFTPAASFTGTTTPVTYEVTDDSGNQASARITVTVNAVTPTATDDTASTAFATPVVFAFATDDNPGDASAPIDKSSGTFASSDQPTGSTISAQGKTITVDKQGAYTLRDDGTVRFAPATGYAGTTTPVTYTIRDANGTAATAKLTVTVRTGPTAEADEPSTAQHTVVTIHPLDNDTPGLHADGTDGSWDVGSVVLELTPNLPANSALTNGGTTLTVPGEGVYQVNPDGTIDFTPAASFTGTTTPVTYEVTDDSGNKASATISTAVGVVRPTATDDSAATPYRTPVTFAFAADDTAGDASAPIDPASGTFESAGQPSGSTISNQGKTITVGSQGSYTLLDDGTVRFAPATGYAGTTTPVVYTIRDANGTAATAKLTVTVRPGPSAPASTASTKQNTDAPIAPLSHATPGQHADGSAGSWDLSSLVLTLTSNLPAGSTLSPDGKTLTVPGEGVYRVNPDGTVTFDPAAAFRGNATPVTFTVKDDSGNQASSTIGVAVTAVQPVATDDRASTVYGRPVTLAGSTNDSAGDASVPLAPSSTVFSTKGQPKGATPSDGGKRLVVSGEGTYVVQSDGTVLFTPAAGFHGTTTPVTYQVADANGTVATATLSVTVQPGPMATKDADSTRTHTPVTVSVLDNDVPSLNADGSDGSWDVSSVTLLKTSGLPAGSTVSADGKTLTVAGEGVYVVASDGTVTFTPSASFSGKATPVTYQVTDANGLTTTATVSIVVTDVRPKAVDDAAATPLNTPVKLSGATNDSAGSDDAPLLPGHTRFPSSGQPDGARVSSDGGSITVRGQGTYVVQDNGAVVFTPVDGFHGRTKPVTYQIVDVNGSTDTATLTVVVRPGPTAAPDHATTRQHTPVTLDLLRNDSPGQGVSGNGGSWDKSSVRLELSPRLPDGSRLGDGGKTLTVPGEGRYVVHSDGTLTFEPVRGFTGTTTPVTYTADDGHGNPVTSTATVDVTAVEPVARDDVRHTAHHVPVTIDVLDNDHGGAGAALDPQSVRLIDPKTGRPTLLVVVPGEGVWGVDDGRVTFAPLPDFTGRTSPVDYIVEDANGTRARATMHVIVGGVGDVDPIRGATRPGHPITLDPVGATTPSPGEHAQPGTVCLVEGSVRVISQKTRGDHHKNHHDGAPMGLLQRQMLPRCVKTLTEPGVGTWTVHPDGSITFAPVKKFKGVAAVGWAIQDSGETTYVDTMTVSVRPHGAVSPATDQDQPMNGLLDNTTGDSADGGKKKHDFLPNTGGFRFVLLPVGLLLVLSGAGLLLWRRRRRDDPLA